MTVEELESVQRLKRELDMELDKQQLLQGEMKSLPARKLDGLPHGTAFQSRTERILVLLDESARRIAELLNQYMDAYTRLMAFIDAALKNKPLLATVARRRWLSGEKIAEIAKAMNYSQQHVFRLQSEAKKLLTAETRS